VCWVQRNAAGWSWAGAASREGRGGGSRSARARICASQFSLLDEGREWLGILAAPGLACARDRALAGGEVVPLPPPPVGRGCHARSQDRARWRASTRGARAGSRTRSPPCGHRAWAVRLLSFGQCSSRAGGPRGPTKGSRKRSTPRRPEQGSRAGSEQPVANNQSFRKAAVGPSPRRRNPAPSRPSTISTSRPLSVPEIRSQSLLSSSLSLVGALIFGLFTLSWRPSQRRQGDRTT